MKIIKISLRNFIFFGFNSENIISGPAFTKYL